MVIPFLTGGAVFTGSESIQNELVLQRPRGTWCAMTIPKEDGEPAMVHAGFEDLIFVGDFSERGSSRILNW